MAPVFGIGSFVERRPGAPAHVAPGGRTSFDHGFVRRVVARVSQGVIAVETAWVLWVTLGNDPRFPAGCDYRIVTDAAARWLAGGPFYPLHQLAGPYPPSVPEAFLPNIMYPPVSLWLFAPFTVLPAVFWWLIPAAAVAWAFHKLRPAWWAWPIIALLWAFPRAPEAVMNGNPVIWALAAVSLGSAYRGPAVLALFKPTLLPFAVVGIRSRRWWLGFTVLVVLCLPFGAMWLDYVRAASNLRSPLWFMWHDWPLLAMPLVASIRGIPRPEWLRAWATRSLPRMPGLSAHLW